MSFTSIPHAIETLRAGRMTIVVDDEHRENEGDLVFAAEDLKVKEDYFIRVWLRQ